MTQVWNRIKNEPVFVGALVIAGFNGLEVFNVITLDVDQLGFINLVVTLLFGAGARQMVYSARTFKNLEGELLDQ